MVGGVVGLLSTGVAAWATLAVYRDGEFDVVFFLPVYTLALLIASGLLFYGALAARLSGQSPQQRYFTAAEFATVAAFASGAAFGFVGISSSGPPTFFLIFVLLPCSILFTCASVGAWFTKRTLS
jgi:hypothetical protein